MAQDSWVVVSERENVPSRRQRRLDRDVVRLPSIAEGPPVMAAIIADERGPWSEVAKHTRGGSLPPGVASLVGFAEVCSWKLELGEVSGELDELARILRRKHKRSDVIGFCSHKFREVVRLETPVVLPERWEEGGHTILDRFLGWNQNSTFCSTSGGSLPPGEKKASGGNLLPSEGTSASSGGFLPPAHTDRGGSLLPADITSGGPLTPGGTRSGGPLPPLDTASGGFLPPGCGSAFESLLGCCIPWAVHPGFAEELLSGSRSFDLSVFCRRQTNQCKMRAVLPLPPRRLVRALLEWNTQELQPMAMAGATRRTEWGGSSREEYTGTFMVEVIRGCQNVRNVKNLKATVEALFGVFGVAGVPAPQQPIPGGQSILRGRIRLDVTAMLMCRERLRNLGTVYRYIGIDASPQSGHELQNVAERCIPKGMVLTGSMDEHLEIRRLPMVTLGVGRMSVTDKVQALLFQIFLENGPSVAGMRAALNSVRQVLSDMGTEFGLADCADILPQLFPSFLLKQQPARGSNLATTAASGSNLLPRSIVFHTKERGNNLLPCSERQQLVPSHSGFLFPLALQIPGVNHILDLCIRDVMSSQAWWDDWQASAKSICQFVSPENNRDWLQQYVTHAMELPEQEVVRYVGALKKAPHAFAAWRWQTLEEVTADLERLSEALVTWAKHYEGSSREAGQRQWRRNSSPQLKTFLMAVGDTQTWGIARFLRALWAPVFHMFFWVKGCDCHEPKVHCPRKGLRAAGLSERVQRLLRILMSFRDGLEIQEGLPFSMSEAQSIVSSAISLLASKFAWVEQLPYIIWQAT